MATPDATVVIDYAFFSAGRRDVDWVALARAEMKRERSYCCANPFGYFQYLQKLITHTCADVALQTALVERYVNRVDKYDLRAFARCQAFLLSVVLDNERFAVSVRRAAVDGVSGYNKPYPSVAAILSQPEDPIRRLLATRVVLKFCPVELRYPLVDFLATETETKTADEGDDYGPDAAYTLIRLCEQDEGMNYVCAVPKAVALVNRYRSVRGLSLLKPRVKVQPLQAPAKHV
jgi:hypothetical protein